MRGQASVFCWVVLCLGLAAAACGGGREADAGGNGSGIGDVVAKSLVE